MDKDNSGKLKPDAFRVEGGPENKISSTTKFVGPSFMLFLDYFFVAIGGWLYWIVISKLAPVGEIGAATTIYSLVISVATMTQLGAEYPLLKRSRVNRSTILGTGLFIQVAMSTAAIPIILLVINTIYDGSLRDFSLIAVTLLVLIAIEFVGRFVLLGILDAKKVLIIDMLGLAMKFLVGYSLVTAHYGAFGMLFAFFSEFLLISVAYLYVTRKKFAFRLGRLGFIKELLKDSLVNAPSKWSNMIIINLSVILLAAIGFSQAEVGVFYITLMISIVVGSFASSMAYMVIPASSASKRDLSTDSLRISLSIITPVVTVLLVAPDIILSLINSEFVQGAPSLVVLAVGTLPFSITVNIITKLNTLAKPKNLIIIGSIQLTTFLLSFFILAQSYASLGAAFSILLAFTSSAIVSLIWSERISMKHTAFCCLSIVAGSLTGYVVSLIATEVYGIHFPLLPILASILVSILIILASKNLSVHEIRYLAREVLQGK
jgi:O-antigen/teichoic acid export membrane protein